MLEIEIKAHCDNPEYLAERIIAIGGHHKADVTERDVYFRHPSRDFAETDEALRIRIQNDDEITLTYKGPKLGNLTKTRIENEVSINDFSVMKDILLKLGFSTVREVVKKRSYYVIDDTDICLDSVSGLGNFAELERKGDDAETGEKILFSLAEKLGLNNFERKSYLELLLEKIPPD